MSGFRILAGFAAVGAFGAFGAVTALGALSAHDDDPAKSGLGTMFAGDVSGEFSGKVAGIGLLQHRPDGGHDGNGYFYLADNEGARELGVTFILPNTVASGHHEISSVGPSEQGKLYSVRIERDLGTTIQALDKNAEGYLDITRFPATGETGQVTGTYDVMVEDDAGKAVRATGVFDFISK